MALWLLGALSGNLLANLLGMDTALGAAVGMVAVVAACITAYIIIGHRSVYPDQMVANPKSLWMRLKPGIALEKEKIHISYGFLKKMRWWQHWKHDRDRRRRQ